MLKDINVTFNPRLTVAITAPNDEDRRAFADVLTREVIPSSGSINLAGLPLSGLHQATIAKRVGYATSRPVMFLGSFSDNVVLPLRSRPHSHDPLAPSALESAKSGNSTDFSDAVWFDLEDLQLENEGQLRIWWLALIKGMHIDKALFSRGLDQRFDAEANPDLAAALVDLRQSVSEKLKTATLDEYVNAFDKDSFNPALSVAENLIFATPKTRITPAL